MKMGLKATKMFFDSKAVTKATDKVTRLALSKFGAFTRTSARSSIRRRKAHSRPGQAPTSQTGLLKKFLFFGYDIQQASVVVGPTPLPTSKSPTGVPRLLEEGGRAFRDITKWRRTKGGRARRQVVGQKTVSYAPRPYMGPAMKVNLPQLNNFYGEARVKVFK